MTLARDGLAQQIGGGGLETLLEQLQNLDSRGALEGFSGPGGTTLDGARGRGLQRGLTGQSGSRSRLNILREQEFIRELKAKRLTLITRFCRDGLVLGTDTVASLNLLLSPLERDYCRRASEPLEQFGYDVFSDAPAPDVLSSGAVQDHYILGIGDEIVLTFRGQTRSTLRATVDREGRIIISEFPPIPVAGRTFGEFRRDVEARTKSSMIGTDVFISLGAIRSVAVTVVGEVSSPGSRVLTGLSTVVEAISAAGGIKKTGSLRRIQVHRGDEIFWVDLYDLLLGFGLSHNSTIADGDRVFVPLIGSTVAVSGNVKRPGIYELTEGQQSTAAQSVLDLAGGPLRPSGGIYALSSFDTTGYEQVKEFTDTGISARDGDIVSVRIGKDARLGTVELLGHVRRPGRRSLEVIPTIRALVGDATVFKENPYLLFAALHTTDPATRSRRLFPVNLQAIINGSQDYALREGDQLIVLSGTDVQYLLSNDVQEILKFGSDIQSVGEPSSQAVERAQKRNEPSGERSVSQADDTVTRLLSGIGIQSRGASQGVPDGGDQGSEGRQSEDGKASNTFACVGLQKLATIVSTTRSGRFELARRALGFDSDSTRVNPLLCPKVFSSYPNLLPLALEHVIAVDGEVRIPGAYPIISGTTLASIVSVAGGLTLDSDLTRVEVTRFSQDSSETSTSGRREMVNVVQTGFGTITVNPGDIVRFNSLFTDRDSGPVLLSGEFVRPGLYDIRRGERLSEIVNRAGGVTAQAYPYGAVFTRERVKRAQQAGFERAVRELNSAATFQAAKKGLDPTAIIALQQITSDLGSQKAIGRVVIEADSTVLQVKPEFDTVLEPGDKLFMPKRPNSVLVIGDVLNPGALQFISGQKADSYIRQAGGFQQSADQDRVFIVYPNGVAQPVSISVWSYNPVHVPPGSTIVAPKNPAPLDIFTFAKDIGQLVSQLAITAASLAVIGDN